MYSFPNLIRKIRDEAGLTQSEFAKALDVSTVLIAMIETGQKEVSKKFLLKLSKILNVHPSSITPFLFGNEKQIDKSSTIERKFIEFGEKMQNYLIQDKAKFLKKYAK